jgi:hypothetical protein
MDLSSSLAQVLAMPQTRCSVISYLKTLSPQGRRALFTLGAEYQRGVAADEYEVIVLLDDQADPDDADAIRRMGPNYRLIRFAQEYAPPWEAINFAVGEARAPAVICCTDGERLLSPGVVRYSLAALNSCSHPLVYALDLDAALPAGGEQGPWQQNGYLLFGAVDAGSRTPRGFFSRVQESSCCARKKRHYLEWGGIDERFRLPCGGLAVADLFDRVEQDKRFSPILLLGEAAFRQQPVKKKGMEEVCRQEYFAIRGRPFDPIYRRPSYYGWVCSDYHGDLLSEPEAVAE